MFIVFAKPAQKIAGKNFAQLKPVQQIQGPWTVQFDKEWLYPVEGLTNRQAQGMFVFDTLVDWTQRKEKAVRFFSGTAKYSTEFELSDVSDDKYVLDLGKVCDMASVKLNGIDLGAVIFSPMRVDVNGAIKKGVNKLEVEVVNRWPNRLIGDGKLPENQRRTKTNISDYYNKPEEGKHILFPSGLLGPVQLTTKNYQHKNQ